MFAGCTRHVGNMSGSAIKTIVIIIASVLSRHVLCFKLCEANVDKAVNLGISNKGLE